MRYPVCKHKSHARRESFVGVRRAGVFKSVARAFTSVFTLSESGFAGFRDFQDGGGPAGTGALGRALDERWRAFASVGRIVWSRICRICWDFQDGGGPAGTGALGRALDERWRAFTRDHERLRVSTCVGWIVWSRICGIFGDFQDGGGPAGTGALVRALDERWRAFTRDHERLRVFTCVGWIVWSRICRICWDFQDGGGPASTGALVRALDESLRAFTRDHERLRVFTSVGWVV